jgi:hypothetical protein
LIQPTRTRYYTAYRNRLFPCNSLTIQHDEPQVQHKRAFYRKVTVPKQISSLPWAIFKYLMLYCTNMDENLPHNFQHRILLPTPFSLKSTEWFPRKTYRQMNITFHQDLINLFHAKNTLKTVA